MAITVTVLGKTVFGNKRVHYGKYTLSGGGTTDEVPTGLQQVHTFVASAAGSSIVADAPTVNETFPLASGDVTIIGTADSAAYWMAIGL